jgi:hypothetical protein
MPKVDIQIMRVGIWNCPQCGQEIHTHSDDIGPDTVYCTNCDEESPIGDIDE